MNYSLSLAFSTESPEKILKIINIQKGKQDRSEINITKKKKKLIFDVKAKDATALKACVNSIIKSLTIYEKTFDMVKNE